MSLISNSATSKPIATVVVGHGSLLRDSGAAMMRIADLLRQQAVTPIVEAGFLNFSQPTFADAVQRAVDAGASRIIVQPYFLIQGHYVAQELPVLVQTVAVRYAPTPFQIADVLGAHPALISLARQRLAMINAAPGRDMALLFVAHGTPIPAANEPITQVLGQVQTEAGYGPAAVGYLECNQPTIAEAFAQLAAAEDVRRIDVLPYFLHLGRHVRKDLPTHFAHARDAYPHLAIHIADHLGYDSLLAAAVAGRVTAKLPGDGATTFAEPISIRGD